MTSPYDNRNSGSSGFYSNDANRYRRSQQPVRRTASSTPNSSPRNASSSRQASQQRARRVSVESSRQTLDRESRQHTSQHGNGSWEHAEATDYRSRLRRGEQAPRQRQNQAPVRQTMAGAVPPIENRREPRDPRTGRAQDVSTYSRSAAQASYRERSHARTANQENPRYNSVQADTRRNGAQSAPRNNNAQSDPRRSSAVGDPRYNANEKSFAKPKRKRSPKGAIIGAVAVVVLAAVGVFGFTQWDANHAIACTLNGNQVTLEGQQRTIQGLMDTKTVTVTPGNYVAVDDSVITQGGGDVCEATVNGSSVDTKTRINEGDVVTLENGKNITEPYTDSNEQTLSYTTTITGSGAMHLFTTQGKDGKKVTRTGKESGKTVDVVTEEPVNAVMTKFNFNTNGDKVICLTFDDGPWPTTTSAILDTLEKNDVKATFFCIGNQMANYSDQVKRMMDDGDQICTHTYDHAAGSGQGVNITYMSATEQVEEVEKGYQCISDITGKEASHIVRLPGGNLNEATAQNLSTLITAEVGWNIDTEDWRRPGSDSIYNKIMQATGGSIILMHDGGGDRTQTAEAIARAIPELKSQGYTFLTLDEMLEKYPYQAS